MRQRHRNATLQHAFKIAYFPHLNHMKCRISIEQEHICHIFQLLSAKLPNNSEYSIYIHLQILHKCNSYGTIQFLGD